MVQPSPSVADATRRALAAFSNNDAAGIRAAFAESDALVAIGTDPAEYFRDHGRMTAVFAEQAAALEGMAFEPGDVDAYALGDVGWSASRPTIRLPDGSDLPMRLTAVFAREGDDWRAVQWHASLGVANEETAGFEDLPTD